MAQEALQHLPVQRHVRVSCRTFVRVALEISETLACVWGRHERVNLWIKKTVDVPVHKQFALRSSYGQACPHLGDEVRLRLKVILFQLPSNSSVASQ